MNKIISGDCLDILSTLPRQSCRLIYIDPPFNTGKIQSRSRPTMEAEVQEYGYIDSYENYLEFLMPRIAKALGVLTPDGGLFVHLDYREVHYVKVALDKLLGRANFKNEIIWNYDFGGRSKSRWSPKHDNILFYTLDPNNYVFNFDQIERIPYMSPGLCGPEKAAIGKTLTDSWWCTIVPTNGKEKTGYPTQKPLKLIDQIVRVHSNPGDTVLDFFAGSGTTGEAAGRNDRRFIMIDDNPDAIKVMQKRLGRFL